MYVWHLVLYLTYKRCTTPTSLLLWPGKVQLSVGQSAPSTPVLGCLIVLVFFQRTTLGWVPIFVLYSKQPLQTMLIEMIFYETSFFYVVVVAVVFNVKPSSLLEYIRGRQLLCEPELGYGGKKAGESASSFLPQCPVLGWLVLIMVMWGNWSLPQVKVLTLNITSFSIVILPPPSKYGWEPG